jgi:hypothetical protein
LKPRLPELKPFENAVPVYDLAAAAGRFSDEQQVSGGLQAEEREHPEHFEWAELPDYFRPRLGMFVAQVVGESMNRVIPNGGWCLFRLNPPGTRQGKVVLVQHREIQDTDTGGHYTVKRYTSEKSQGEDGSWQHTRIVLRPDTDRASYEPIVLERGTKGRCGWWRSCWVWWVGRLAFLGSFVLKCRCAWEECPAARSAESGHGER